MGMRKTEIAIVAVLGIAVLAITADAVIRPQVKITMRMDALPPSAVALPSTPVGVSMGPRDHGITVGSNGYSNDTSVWATATGGAHWTKVLSVSNLLTTAYWTNRSLQTIWVAGVADRPKPHDPQWLQPMLWHSADGGRSWTRIVPVVPRLAGFHTKAVDWTSLVWSARPLGWAITTAGQVLKTADGGHRWSLVPTLEHQSVRQVQFVNPDDGWALTSSTNTARSIVWHTTDGGETWHRQRLPVQIDALAFVSATRGWAAGGTRSHGRWLRTLWSTTDRGRHWTAHDLGTVAYADEVMAGVAVASSRMLWATSDGSVNSPPPWAVNQPLAYHLWVSQNGGKTWAELKLPASVGTGALPQFPTSITGWEPVLASRGLQEYLYRWQLARQRWVPVT